MHPVLIKPFGFAIYSFSAVLLLAFIASIALAIWIAKRRGPTDSSFIQDMAMMGIIWGLIGGRVGEVFWNFETYWNNPIQVFYLRDGGMTILGGILMPIIVLYIYFKYKGVEPLNLMDTFAAPLLLGMAIGRIGCILNGCCQGNVCDPSFPLALTYPVGKFDPAGPRYPSQLFESFADLILMGFVIWLIPRIKFAGQAIYTVLFGYGIIRFLNEFTRGDIKYIGPMTLAQWVGIAMAVVGLLGLLGVFGKPAVDNSWQKGFSQKDKSD